MKEITIMLCGNSSLHQEKKISFYLVCAFLSTFILPLYSSASIFPEKTNFTVNVITSVEKVDRTTKYTYSVQNSVSSLQSIKYFRVEHDDQNVSLKNILVPPNWLPGKQIVIEDDFKEIVAQSGLSSSFQPAVSWLASPLPGTTIEEYDRFPPKSAIHPGEKIEFTFQNQQTPIKIVNAFIQGWAPTPRLDEENNRILVGDRIIENAEDYADSIFAGLLPNSDERTNSINIKTLGPAAPIVGQQVICDTFILDLVGQVREAVAAGWIKHDLRKESEREQGTGNREQGKNNDKNVKQKDDDEGDDNGDDDEMDEADKKLPGVAKSIIQKLTKVRRECLRGKFGSAREKLRALIKQVNAQRGKHLTEEAYALIKFNAEFLLEKL